MLFGSELAQSLKLNYLRHVNLCFSFVAFCTIWQPNSVDSGGGPFQYGQISSLNQLAEGGLPTAWYLLYCIFNRDTPWGTGCCSPSALILETFSTLAVYSAFSYKLFAIQDDCRNRRIERQLNGATRNRWVIFRKKRYITIVQKWEFLAFSYRVEL